MGYPTGFAYGLSAWWPAGSASELGQLGEVAVRLVGLVGQWWSVIRSAIDRAPAHGLSWSGVPT